MILWPRLDLNSDPLLLVCDYPHSSVEISYTFFLCSAVECRLPVALDFHLMMISNDETDLEDRGGSEMEEIGVDDGNTQLLG